MINLSRVYYIRKMSKEKKSPKIKNPSIYMTNIEMGVSTTPIISADIERVREHFSTTIPY